MTDTDAFDHQHARDEVEAFYRLSFISLAAVLIVSLLGTLWISYIAQPSAEQFPIIGGDRLMLPILTWWLVNGVFTWALVLPGVAAIAKQAIVENKKVTLFIDIAHLVYAFLVLLVAGHALAMPIGALTALITGATDW